ncbi:MAG: cell wall-binding repeat-containing protein [Clostridiaceae bacterium]
MSKKSHKALASATVMSLILTSTLTAVPVSAAASVERLEGAGREETAISVAKKAFADGAETVVLVNGYGYGDAVSATPLAKALNAPILLTNKVDVPSADLLNALSSLKAKKVVIVGGEGVVTKALANKLAETYTVERIGGASRYETNAGVAKKVLELTGKKEAFLVNGQDGYADALSVASIAATKGAPVLFGNKNEVPSVVKNVAEGLTVSAVGGTGVLPTSVVDSVKGTRVAEGKDRFATNLEVLKKFKDDLKLDSIYMAFGGATPTQFADALVASAAAAKVGAPVVLSGSKNSDASTSAAKDYIKANHKDNTKIYLVGGTGSLDSAIESSIKDMVNPVVTNLELVSVKSDNLKQVVLEFNQELDKESAEEEANYKIKDYTLDKDWGAVLSKDGKSVTLSLQNGDTTSDIFDRQEEHELEITGVKNKDKSKTFSKEKIKFSPVDVTLPTVKEVKALGTKAFKIEFSEPVKKSSASTTAAYKIDGKSIAGTVKYDYASNSVIVSTSMTTGEHKLSVSDVEDFAGHKLYGKDIPFTVVEDKEAPVIVSAKTTDLTEVELEFNEPIKNVGKVYHGTSKNTGKVKITDNKVVIDFSDHKMGLGDTTIFLEGVEDYSGNKADRNTVVKPAIDTEKPTVNSVKVENKEGLHEFTIKFSKNVDKETAEKRENYTLKDNDGKVVTGKGLDAKGHPVVAVNYNKNNKEVTFKLTEALKSGEYTLEVSGVQDVASVPNIMMPYSTKVEVGDTKAPTLSKVWVEENTTGLNGKIDQYIYIRYSEAMAADGDGNATDRAKYSYQEPGTTSFKPLPTEAKVELVTSDTIKIKLPRVSKGSEYIKAKTIDSVKKLGDIRVALVADLEGNYLKTNDEYIGIKSIQDQGSIGAKSVKATAKDTIEVEFEGKLSYIDEDDFLVAKGAGDSNLKSVNLETYKVNDDGNTIAVFGLDSDDKLDSSIASTVTFKTRTSNVSSQDEFGTKVSIDNEPIEDKIRPEVKELEKNDKQFNFEKENDKYVLSVDFDEELNVVAGATDIVSVKIDGKEIKIAENGLSNEGSLLKINLGETLTKKSNGEAFGDLNNNLVIEVQLKDGNDSAKIVTDASANRNAAVSFTRSAILSEIKAGLK